MRAELFDDECETVVHRGWLGARWQRRCLLEVGRQEFGGNYFWHDQWDQPALVAGEPIYHVALTT